MKKLDLPHMPFYVGDWLKCPEVRSLPPDYRGLWFDMICYMWESTERGVMIRPNGRPYSDADILRMVGLDNQNSSIWLTTLENNNVFSRRSDGAIFCRKMVRDEEIRQKRRNSGRKGGNPMLLVNHRLTNLVNQNTDNDNDNDTDNDNAIDDDNINRENYTDEINDILRDLNTSISSNYKSSGKKTRELIITRLKEGFTVDDFKTVHRKKIEEWGLDQNMRSYLRPITLYSNKFESYLNQPERIGHLTESQKATVEGMQRLEKKWAENKK